MDDSQQREGHKHRQEVKHKVTVKLFCLGKLSEYIYIVFKIVKWQSKQGAEIEEKLFPYSISRRKKEKKESESLGNCSPGRSAIPKHIPPFEMRERERLSFLPALLILSSPPPPRKIYGNEEEVKELDFYIRLPLEFAGWGLRRRHAAVSPPPASHKKTRKKGFPSHSFLLPRR